MFSQDVTPEEMKVFLAEASEQIDLLDEDIVRLEKESGNTELLQEIFRAAHTLKGSSAMVGLHKMAKVTHAMESLLDKVRNSEIEVSADIIDALLGGLDAVKTLKDHANVSEEGFEPDISRAISELHTILGNEAAAASDEPHGKLILTAEAISKLHSARLAGKTAYQIRINLAAAGDWKSIRCLQCVNELARLGEIIASCPSDEDISNERVGRLAEIVLVSEAEIESVRSGIASVGDVSCIDISDYFNNSDYKVECDIADNANRQENIGISNQLVSGDVLRLQSVKVDVQMLDKLMNIVEELVTDRSNISQVGKALVANYPGDSAVRQFVQISDRIIKIVNELHECIMRVRMVPVSTIFSRFPRMVRDIAQSQGKSVEFSISGEHTELDRTIIERVRDPLIHLLRNAVDHGIESPDERRAAGKPEKAVIRLSAVREQSHIIISVEDDGKGISAAKVRSSAVKKGLISAAQAERLTDFEVQNLIYKAGMSTAEKTTELSGRGVGMDIVKSNIDSLGGSISLDTAVTKGTKFIIKLPLTVSVMQGLLVTSAETVFVIPLVSVVEAVAISQSDIHTIQGRSFIRRLDKVIPVNRLEEAFALFYSPVKAPAGATVVIVTTEESAIGLVVDSLMEPQEVVVKSLGNYLGDMNGIAGATILGDGRAALILDVESLVRTAATAGAAPERELQLSASGTYGSI